MPQVEILDARDAASASAAVADAKVETPAVSAATSHLGRSATKRRADAITLKKRLHRETRVNPADGRTVGPLRPCTVVNFNPIDLVLRGVMGRFTVPAAGTSPAKQVTIRHGGRNYVGQYVVIQNPVIYPSPVGYKEDPQIVGLDMPDMVMKHLTPHAIGCELWHQYNSPAVKLTGGMLFFDQTVHWISAAALERTGNTILVPTRTQEEDSMEFVFDLRETSLDEELVRIFTAQRGYCDAQIQMAHSLHTTNDPTQQAMITDTMRGWARYAKKMFWMKDLPAWASERLTAADPVLDLRRCKYCGTQQAGEEVFFCPQCNAPFDAYKAFRARLHVPMQYLELLEGKELAEVQRALASRKSKLSIGETEEPAKIPSKGAKAD